MLKQELVRPATSCADRPTPLASTWAVDGPCLRKSSVVIALGQAQTSNNRLNLHFVRVR